MRFVSLFLGLLLLLSFTLTFPVYAKEKVDSNDSGIPEVDGDYQDPYNSRVRVRVFVHKAKSHTIQPLISCDDLDSSTTVGWAGWKII